METDSNSTRDETAPPQHQDVRASSCQPFYRSVNESLRGGDGNINEGGVVGVVVGGVLEKEIGGDRDDLMDWTGARRTWRAGG